MLTIAPPRCRCCARDGQRAEEVGVEQRAQLGVGRLLQRADHAVAGVVDQHVDAPEARDRRIDGRLGGARDVDVERHRQHALGRPRDEVGQRVDAPRRGHDVVAARDRVLGEGAAEAGRGAGDEPGLDGGHGEGLSSWAPRGWSAWPQCRRIRSNDKAALNACLVRYHS